MDLLAETPRGVTPRTDSDQIEELQLAAVENRVSYVKNALKLDKIGGLEDSDSDCDTGDEGTPGLSKKKAVIEREFQAFQDKDFVIQNRLSDLSGQKQKYNDTDEVDKFSAPLDSSRSLRALTLK